MRLWLPCTHTPRHHGMTSLRHATTRPSLPLLFVSPLPFHLALFTPLLRFFARSAILINDADRVLPQLSFCARPLFPPLRLALRRPLVCPAYRFRSRSPFATRTRPRKDERLAESGTGLPGKGVLWSVESTGRSLAKHRVDERGEDASRGNGPHNVR